MAMNTSASALEKEATTVSVTRSLSEDSQGPWSQRDHEMADLKGRPHARTYDVSKTFASTLPRTITQWLTTVAIAATMGGVLVHYSGLQSLSPFEKRMFNALILALSIALSVNIASSLRSYASLLRWRLAATLDLSLRELDLVLGCTSQIKVVKLLFTARRRPRFPYFTVLQVVCVGWILLNLASQVLVAVTGLTYSVNTSQTETVLLPGVLSVANLSPSGDAASQRVTAHNYGLQSAIYNTVNTRTPLASSTQYKPGSPPAVFDYAEAVNTYSLYRFRDMNAADNSIVVPSERTILASTICTDPMVSNVTDAYDDGKKLPGSLVTYSPNWQNGASTIYVREWSNNGTTYISDSDPFCGPRCTHVYLFMYLDSGLPMLYDCNSTVGAVDAPGATSPASVMPDEQARWYAGAVGWNGAAAGWYGAPAVSSALPPAYARFESASYVNSMWAVGPHTPMNGPDSIAVLIERFAAGAIAGADQYGPRTTVAHAATPQRAQVLSVQWRAVAALLAVLASLQLAGLLAVAAWASRVVLKDDSHLAVAQLLAPEARRLGGHGSALRGDEIAAALAVRDVAGRRVRYGWRPAAEGGEGDRVKKVELVEAQPGARHAFEAGIYD